MIQANFTVSPSSGYVLATQYTVTNLTTSDSTIQQYNWDSGTGTIQYNVKSPTFTYNYPGTYNISLTARDYNGSTSVYTQLITTDLLYRDYITFSQIPNNYANPGLPTDEPFEISVISSNSNSPLVVDLYAANSLSTPLEFVPSKWNFLTPTWYFTDINSNKIKSLVVPSTPVYVNNVVVAVSGTAKFYYVDSMSTGNPTDNCPLLITATLQTSGFSNPTDSNIYAYPSYANNTSTKVGITWQVNDLIPNLLKVTNNYIDNINPNQYNGIKIPTLITYHGNRANVLPGSNSTTSEVLFSYPSTNSIGNTSPIQVTLSGASSTNFSLEQTPLYIQSTDINGAIIGGYVFTSLTPLTSINSTTIVASTTAYSGNTNTGRIFPYPRGYVPNPSVWVSNPEQNVLNKITVTPYSNNCNPIINFKNNNALLDGYIKQASVPAIPSTSTYNYSVSGFSGVYGIAVDPRDYSVVVTDAEADYLYRFTNTGVLTASYNFYNLDHYNPYQTTFIGQDFSITTPYLSSTSYYLYNLSTPSTSSNNYIVTLNGVVQLPNTYSITKDSIFNFTVSDPTPAIPSTLNVTEIYNTSLPSNYISSIQYWLSSSPIPAITFPLTGSPALSANTNYYVTSIDGIIQSPTSYTIDTTNNNVVFSQPVPANVPVQVTFIPTLLNPQTQQYNFPYNTNKLSISSFIPLITDPYTTFFINVGGVYEGSLTYTVDIPNSQLILDSYIPSNTDIFVTYTCTLSTVNQPRAYTPSSISLDSNYNIWVSLFNDIYVLKFDPNFNLLFKTSPASLLGISDTTTYPGDSKVSTDFYGEDFLLKPPVVETDRQNNCWATYAYPFESLLVKYNGIDGTPLKIITLPTNSTPGALTIDINNNVWVANNYSTSSTTGSIQLYNGTTYTLMSSITGIPRPGELSLNRDGNLWFTHSTRGIGYINTITGNVNLWYNDINNVYNNATNSSFLLTTYPPASTTLYYTNSSVLVNSNSATLVYQGVSAIVGSSSNIVSYTGSLLYSGGTTDSSQTTGNNAVWNILYNDYSSLSNVYSNDEDFSSIAVDVYDRVWYIDSNTNSANIILSAVPAAVSAVGNIRTISIIPNNFIGYYTDPNNNFTFTTITTSEHRSAQAVGDWTGNRWYQKYTNINTLSSVAISGISTPFAVANFNNPNQIKRVNESFNTAAYYKALALPENLNSNTVLFDQFFAAAVGTGTLSASEDLGQVVYERTANFAKNHSDIDTCLTDQLLNLAETVDINPFTYATYYPSDIKNMLDIASTPKDKLWGVQDQVPLMPESVGPQYDVNNDYVTAGTKIVLQSKFDSTLSIVQVPPLNGSTTYPLTQFQGYGFIQPVYQNYNIFQFVPVYNNSYINNIIDWNANQTTLSPTNSSFNAWYGDNGIIENTFRYLLTKNLFLK
jgi:streptogramin lyase